MNYVYLESPHAGPHDNSLYTVGFYDPKGAWVPVQDCEDVRDAEKKVHYLNGGQEPCSNEVIISTGKHCIVPKTQAEENEDLKIKLKVCEERRDEFLGQRNAYGQLAYSLAEHIKALDQGKTVRYPVHLIAQVDLARGVAGRYQWPEGERKIE